MDNEENDCAGIVVCMAGTLHDLGDVLWTILTGMDSWVLIPGFGRAA